MTSRIVGAGHSSKLPSFQQVTKDVLPVLVGPQMTIVISALSGISGSGSGYSGLPTDESKSKHTEALSDHADAFCSTHLLLKLLTSG